MTQTKPESEKQQVSVCPNNEVFPLPGEQDYADEFRRLKQSVQQQKQKGREIVVVMGCGLCGRRDGRRGGRCRRCRKW